MKRIALCLLISAAAAAALGWICQVDPSKCNGCGTCLPWCPLGAISMSGPDAVIDPEICDGCGICMDHCPRRAIYRVWQESSGEGSAALPALVLRPNPSSGMVLVEGLQPGTSLAVFDAAGRPAASAVASELPLLLDLSTLSPGSCSVSAGGKSARLVLL